MTVTALTSASCKDSVSATSRFSGLLRAASTSLSPANLSKIAATALIGASAGLGSLYAWQSGTGDGLALAILLVLMAIGCELAKPFAISAGFEAFRELRLVQGCALLLLGLVAVAYSLTAELSLMATARGDRVAERVAVSDQNLKANERYDRARLELLSMTPTRPADEVNAQIEGLLRTPGVNGCSAIDGKITRVICPRVDVLKAEAARSERRAALEAAVQEAGKELGKAPVAKESDPGAAALAAYLALLGLDVAPKLLTDLLVLVGVLALEVGSALSLVLVQAVKSRADSGLARTKTQLSPMAVHPTGGPVVHPDFPGVPADADNERRRVQDRILGQLRTTGGKVSGSQRGLAKLIGANKTTMRRAINGLVVAGLVAMEATRNGTMLRLVG